MQGGRGCALSCLSWHFTPQQASPHSPTPPHTGVEDKSEGDAESLVVMDMGGSVLGLGAGAAGSGAGGAGTSAGTGAGAGAAGVSSGTGSEVHAPGAYRSICVELRLHHLAVNAIDKVWEKCGECNDSTDAAAE